MRKVVVAATAIVLFASAGAALAAERATGKVMAVDSQTRTLSLESGRTFNLSEEVSVDGIEEGAEVTVSFEEHGGQSMATDIRPIDAQDRNIGSQTQE